MAQNEYNIIKLLETESTNEYAKKLGRDGALHGTVVTADSQSAGKGRLGRSFNSEKDKGIYMSILLRPEISPAMASGLTLVAAVAVHDAMMKVCGIDVGIKWPNDIVYDGKKLCGILTEMSVMSSEGVRYVVVGIGVNVLNESFVEGLLDVATSLFMITGKRFSKELLIDAILEEFNAYYHKYIEDGNLSKIVDYYNKNLIHTGQMIKGINGNDIYKGICHGIDDTGALLVEVDDDVKRIISGEISVRGVYGYV